ncbi:MAG: YqaA family protein [Paracoccaceae bacterium]|nr:YqaA family protein [Paracoccaceae bacterium]
MFSALSGLLVAAFLAATLVPFQSELVFLALQAAKAAPLWLLIAVASVGNTAGAFVNYALGRGVTRWQDRRWFPLTPLAMARAQTWFQRWGVWVLLLSWAPVGDVVTLVAGVMRTPLWLFGLLVAVAKTGRYVVLGWLATHVLG